MSSYLELIRQRRVLALAAASDRRREIRQRQIRRRRQRALLRANIEPFKVPHRNFVKSYRLTKSLAKVLINELTPLIKTPRRRDGLSVDIKVLTALSFYATGSYQNLVGQSSLNNISQPSVSRAVKEVTEALNEVYENHVIWPANCQARTSLKGQFYAKYGIPGAIGCIDGTHVALITPSVHEERYVNRKGFHSLNVMIICDADMNVLCVDASRPGSTHDATVWQNHPLHQHLIDVTNSGEECFLLGDSGYALRPTMITPILNTVEGSREYYFYQKQVTARNTVERCIGLLKARFRCLLAARELHYDPVTAGKIVNACVVLHNIANRQQVDVDPLSTEEIDAEYGRFIQNEEAVVPQNPPNRRVNVELQRGRDLQQRLVERLWSEREEAF